MPTIIAAGLGPGSWKQVTLEVQRLLDNAQVVYLRTRTHPTADHLPQHLEVRTFDYLYEQESRFEEIYRGIAEALIEVATRQEEPVIYCVPGHPSIGEASVRHLRVMAAERNVNLKIAAGLSFLEPVCDALALDPLQNGLQIVDGTELGAYGTVDDTRPASDQQASGTANPASPEPFLFSSYSLPLEPGVFPALAGLSPMYPVLLTQVYNDRIASACKLALMERYPDEHPVTIVLNAGVEGLERIVNTTLAEVDHGHGINHLACVYLGAVEPLALTRDFDSLVYVMGRLRGPGGCPWDREQTHDSIKHHLIEEAYEAVDAMDSGDPELLAEELGDLLLQVVFHSQLALSAEEFTLSDVVGYIVSKLIRRHPHVFGDVQVTGAANVLRNWEIIKAGERVDKARAGRKFEAAQAAEQGLEGTGLLLSVPRAMPALERAQQLQVRSARVGFDWREIKGVFEKVREEVNELEVEDDIDKRREELGDVLFTLVCLSEWMGINAEEAMRRANDKYLGRFSAMERAIAADGKKMREMTVEEMDEYWNRIKREAQSPN